MKMLPISVLMSVFNAEKYLEKALLSIFNQSQNPKEIIVINDGSTDNSLNILNKFKDKIRIISRENRGVPFSINQAIKQSSQKWISFLDADDYWSSNKLEQQFEFLMKNRDVLIVFGKTQQFISEELDLHIRSKIFVPKDAQMGYLRPTMIVNRSVFDIVGGFNDKLIVGDFIDWFQKCQELKVKIGDIDEIVHFRRLHQESLSSNHSNKKYFAILLKQKLDRNREALKI